MWTFAIIAVFLAGIGFREMVIICRDLRRDG